MPWTKNDYPDSLRNLAPAVREKTIEIANALLDEGHGEGAAIAIATQRAEQWARGRGQRVEARDAQADNRTGERTKRGLVHVLPHGDGWAVRFEHAERADSHHDDKGSALSRAEALADSANTDIVLHRQDGTIQDTLSRRRVKSPKAYHVTPRGKEWVVQEEGAEQAIRVFDTKAEARSEAQGIAENQAATLYIHDAKGRVQDVERYSAPPERR